MGIVCFVGLFVFSELLNQSGRFLPQSAGSGQPLETLVFTPLVNFLDRWELTELLFCSDNSTVIHNGHDLLVKFTKSCVPECVNRMMQCLVPVVP